MAGWKCVATRFVSVRAAARAAPKNKTKGSISTGGRQQVQLAGLSIFGGGLDWGEARKKKKTRREVLKSVWEEKGGADRRKRDRCAVTC